MTGVPVGDDPHAEVFDAGLQPERTLLAWRRTCLSIAAGFVATIKYFTDAIGAWAIALGVVGLGLAGMAWFVCTLRYRRVHRGLVNRGALTSGGTLPLLVAGAVSVGAVTALIAVTVTWHP
ncbi:hypothetical protein LK09_19195 [Microbacterium mangrovi]|uniref:DUF202 domain-containing protein n=1 Tax=Microbacterium mangrovi TaxID=1348253 RepID=A0A0B1ZXM4_9MICO|nr:DUF202 domain-containing protein [Microbacterium mangrovi]KHK95499.1 hypothetical protein LK09_19195 [Microbacterium mangrovi]